MNWININVAVIDSEEFLGSEPTERGTWLCLQRYCVGQENGGRIAGAKEWKDRKWQQVVRVTLREVSSKCDLWAWESDDLVVAFYPIEKEIEVKTNRSNGAKGGRPTKKKPDGLPNDNHPVSNGETERLEIVETERNRKGIGKEGNTHTPTARASEALEIEACESFAKSCMQQDPEFAASVGRQFHGLFSVNGWRTQNGVNLLQSDAWKHRLRQMIEEEARKPRKPGQSSAPTKKLEKLEWE